MLAGFTLRREVTVRTLYGVLIALLLMAIPLLIADNVSAELVMDLDAVVWAQDAGPPLVIVGSDTMQTIGREIFIANKLMNEPAAVRSDNLETRSMVSQIESTTGAQKPTTSLGDGTRSGRMVPAWRVGIVRVGQDPTKC